MFTAGGARARTHGLALCLLVASAVLGGCNNNGSYEVRWQFADSFVAGDCGRVGVQGIAITATKSGGSQAAVSVPCALGFYDGSLEEGTWTLALVALDASGQVKEQRPGSTLLSSQAAGPVEIRAGEHAAAIPPVTLMPLPQCRDGVDNDLDGRVDLDDADCNNADGPNPDGPTECGATDGPSCNPHLPGAQTSSP
jgi:hypothetical protein